MVGALSFPFHTIAMAVVAPASMRYQTVGDWQVKDTTLVVTVADTGEMRSNLLVGIHEAVEATIFLVNGGKEKDVDAFDHAWDEKRSPYEEAGNDPAASYHRAHVIATLVERHSRFTVLVGEGQEQGDDDGRIGG